MTAHKEPSHLDKHYLQMCVRIYLMSESTRLCSEVELSGDETMCGSKGGERGSGPPPPPPPPPPGKSQAIWVSIEININNWTLDPPPPPRKVGPP